MAKTRAAKKPKLRPIIVNSHGIPPLQMQWAKRAGGRRLKRVSWRDEECDEGQQQEFADPAILAVGTVPALLPPVTVEFRYSHDELLQLRNSPYSMKRPDYLDAAYYNSEGVWDPDASSENGGGRSGGDNEGGNHKRRPGDPRERIRKEQDGIVLSPQRRSFNSGCFVPLREPLRPNRPHSPLGAKSEAPHMVAGHRDLNSGPPARRIGSGRILPWDFQEKTDVDNDFGYRRERRETDREDKFERRSFSRDFDIAKEKDRHLGRNNNNNGRFSNRRISNESREEEPEWFSSGPMSQNDTIELRGFDENEKLGAGSLSKKKQQQKKKQKEQSQKSKEPINDKIIEETTKKNENAATTRASGPQRDEGSAGSESTRTQHSPAEKGGGEGPHVGAANISSDASFNFEDILKCESIPGIPGLLSNGVESGDAAGSRFSRWFQREKSPPQNKQNESSRRSSLQDQDHHHIIKNLLSDPFNEPSVAIPQPGDSESYFAPISPAASSMHSQTGQPQSQQQQNKAVNLIEMLQRGNKPPLHAEGPPPPLKGLGDVPGPGKILSLEELEARMMQGLDISTKHQQKGEEDTNAFKRLFSQVNTGLNHHMSNGPTAPQKPMSIMDMLAHSQQQDEAARLVGQRIGPSNLPPHLAEMSFKLQQVQNQVQQQQKQQAQLEMLSKLMTASQAIQQARASPLQEMGITQSRELLNRPEAQAILQAMHQRIPSPRELQVHTQNIMQRALIKKKLEEQEENFRKKQAQQRGTSPAKTASPTPLAFTPTAVLRKMTADKDDGSKEGKGEKIPQGRAVTGMRPQAAQQQQVVPPQSQNWSNQFPQQLKQPAGRPIVKANNNYQPPSQTQQQENYFQQQRLLQQQQQQQQQRKSQSFGGANFPSQNQQPQQFSQLSQQQLRAQHQNVRSQHQQQQQYSGGHQQQPSWAQQMMHGQGYDNRQVGRGGIDGDLSPTSNQLARWFSPDLLDRARKGKLPGIPPSAVAQHALSLEEVERQTTPVGHN